MILAWIGLYFLIGFCLASWIVCRNRHVDGAFSVFFLWPIVIPLAIMLVIWERLAGRK